MTASVPEGFRLPWSNRTMADVWGERRREPSSAKIPYAGTDDEKFILQDWSGAYWSIGCTGMTNSHRYAWRGTERQLQALRRRYPKTANLIASVE